MDEQKKMQQEDNRRLFWYAVLILLFTFLITAGSMIFFKRQVGKATQALDEETYREYARYYMMIVEDAESDFWQEVYQGAHRQAEENGVCVELMNGLLAGDYSREELVHIAVESGVDGIIVQADDSERLTQSINEAVDSGIPVITVLGDDTVSRRQSFVGVGSYNLGREYGRQVLQLCAQRSTLLRENGKKRPLHVYVLMDTRTENNSQNILYSGIQETIAEQINGDEIVLDMYAVNNESRFYAEESIRDLFMKEEEQPDILICLDDLNTSCVYQAVVDYNRVGETDIIGYYESEDILRAIERNVVYSTIVVDSAQMGEYCVEALDELADTGYVSEYFSVDTHLINAENVAAYLEEENED